MAMLPVPIVRLDPELPLPTYAHQGDAGLDLRATTDVVVDPAGGRALVPTGIAIAIPHGFAGFVLPRSGNALKHGVTVVNAPGTVDSGYRGEVLVNLVNLDPSEPFTVRVGDRIAQLVVQRYLHADFDVTDSLPDSARGETGHGSTGGFGPDAPR